MNAQKTGTPLIAQSSDGQSIPDALASLTLIEKLAASHAAVLEKWNRNFALNLRRPDIPLPS